MDYSSEIVYEGAKALQHMLMDVTERKLFGERFEAFSRNVRPSYPKVYG
jgi:hypothetical protein